MSSSLPKPVPLIDPDWDAMPSDMAIGGTYGLGSLWRSGPGDEEIRVIHHKPGGFLKERREKREALKQAAENAKARRVLARQAADDAYMVRIKQRVDGCRYERIRDRVETGEQRIRTAERWIREEVERLTHDIRDPLPPVIREALESRMGITVEEAQMRYIPGPMKNKDEPDMLLWRNAIHAHPALWNWITSANPPDKPRPDSYAKRRERGEKW